MNRLLGIIADIGITCMFVLYVTLGFLASLSFLLMPVMFVALLLYWMGH